MSSEAMTVQVSKKGRPRGRQGPHLKGCSRDARHLAALVLETLAGGRTPTEAAVVLGVSLPRYYALELRALKGLLEGCEPREKGPGKQAEREAERLKKEVSKLERQLQRQEALTRATQRAIGLYTGPSGKAKKKGQKKAARRRRNPTVRGLRAAAHLKAEESTEAVEASTEG